MPRIFEELFCRLEHSSKSVRGLSPSGKILQSVLTQPTVDAQHAADGVARLMRQTDGVQREFTVACSYLEIYNESITDLLTAETGLPIREDPRTGPFVEGLSVEAVKDGEYCRQMRHCV